MCQSIAKGFWVQMHRIVSKCIILRRISEGFRNLWVVIFAEGLRGPIERQFLRKAIFPTAIVLFALTSRDLNWPLALLSNYPSREIMSADRTSVDNIIFFKTSGTMEVKEHGQTSLDI